MIIRSSLLLVCCGAMLATLASASSMQDEVMSYCQSMIQAGTPAEEARQIIDDCMNEQSSYMDVAYQDSGDDQDTSYDQEAETMESIENEAQSEANYVAQDDCYQLVDEDIQQKLDANPDYDYDYDVLLEQCFNRTY